MTPLTTTDDLFRDGAKTVAQAVKFYGIGRTQLYALMNSGRIRYTQLGKRRLIPDAEIRRALSENLVGAK